MEVNNIFFFFSSRRRHTSSLRDWSSDVCSSDLARAGVEMVGTLAGLLAQALLYGPTPIDEAIARVEGLPDELDLDPTLRGSVHTSLAGLLALRGDLDQARRMFRDAAATYEEFGLRFRRATQSFVGAQIELLAGDIEAAERHLRASSAAFDEF